MPTVDTELSANVTAPLWRRAAAHDPNDVFRVWRDGAWRGLTCTEVADRVRDLAAGLLAMGVEPGARIALLCTGVDRALADLAVLAAGGVTVPHDAGKSEVLALDDAALDVVAARAGEPERREVAARVAATTEHDHALVVEPRDGAVTHGQLLALARRPASAPLHRRDTVLLCGPAGSVEEEVVLLQCLDAGATVAYPRGPETVLEDLQSFSPTVVSAPAATFERIVAATGARPEGHRSRTFDFAVTSAVQWAGREDPRTRDTIRRSISDKLVYRDLRDAMGGQVRHSLCSQGALHPDVAAVFAAADIPVRPASGVGLPPR